MRRKSLLSFARRSGRPGGMAVSRAYAVYDMGHRAVDSKRAAEEGCDSLDWQRAYKTAIIATNFVATDNWALQIVSFLTRDAFVLLIIISLGGITELSSSARDYAR